MNESTRNFLIFLFLLYIIASPVADEERYPSSVNKGFVLDQYRKEVNVSRAALLADYEQGYGNVTGLRLSYNDAIKGRNASHWPFPHRGDFQETEDHSILANYVSTMAGNVWNSEGKVVDVGDKAGERINEGAFPLNVTGSVLGDFRLDRNVTLHPIPMDLPAYLFELYKYRENQRLGNHQDNDEDDNGVDFGRDDDGDDILRPLAAMIPARRPGNVTDLEGEVALNLINVASVVNDTTMVAVTMKINDRAEHNEHSLSFNGVYHQDSGNLVITTRSAKFQGSYALPHFNLGPGDLYNRTMHTVYDSLNRTGIEDIGFPNIEPFVDAVDQCEYVGYFHFESTNLTRDQLHNIETELASPLGRPNKPLPNLKVSSGILYSPDCGILLTTGGLVGKRNEVFNSELRHLVIVAIGIMALQLVLVIRQMAQMSSPSSLAKLSFWTMMTLNTIDSGVCIMALIMSLVFTELYVQFAMLSFLAFTCSALYEMKFAIQIYCIQINERPLDWRTMLQGTPIDDRVQRNQSESPSPAEDTPTQNGQVPTTPAVAAGTAFVDPPAAVAIDGSEQAIGAELYSRNFFFMLVLIFLLLNVITWPRASRRIVECMLAFVMNSLWAPQIYRNTLRGSRTSFTWEFILGQSFLRLVPFLYIELFPNPFNHHSDMRLVVVILCWVAFQILMLHFQEEYGPRFFLSEKYLPQTYNYHPALQKSDLTLFHVDPNTVQGDVWVTDCAICMQKVELPLATSSEDESNEADVFEQANDLESGLLTPHSDSARHGMRLVKRKKYMVTPCHHVFHTNCLENWMMYKLQCPNCRSSIPPF